MQNASLVRTARPDNRDCLYIIDIDRINDQIVLDGPRGRLEKRWLPGDIEPERHERDLAAQP